MKTLYLCGAGNAEGVRLALTVNRSTRRWERLALVDDDPAKLGHAVLGVEVEGPFDLLARADPAAAEVSNMVARTTLKRSTAQVRIGRHGLAFASLIAPDVNTEGAELGRAVTVYEHATVCPLSAVGDDSVVFMNAVVGHGCRVDRGCVIAPGAVLNARVRLGEGVYVGSNATVLPELTVGAGATIGAGSVVLEDVPAGATVFGVPAQRIGTAPAASSNASAVDLERELIEIWHEVLTVTNLGVDVNFFDAGGSSLAAIQVCVRVRERARVDLELTDVFRFPTVRSLARHLTTRHRPADRLDAAEHRADLRRQLHLSHGAAQAPASSL
jgi:sugar O-acyltransferase (sialic acid O-acetyltransferase NeuD family)